MQATCFNTLNVRATTLRAMLSLALMALFFGLAATATCHAKDAPARLKKIVGVLPPTAGEKAKALPDDFAAQYANALEAALKENGLSTRKSAAPDKSAAKEAAPAEKKNEDDPFAAIEAEAAKETETKSEAALIKSPPGAQFTVVSEMREHDEGGNIVLQVRVLSARDGALLGEREFEEAAAGDTAQWLPELSGKIAGFVAAQTEAVAWEAQVAQVETNDAGIVLRVFLRAGSDDGVQVGDRFNVYRPGKAVTDPETGEVLSPAKDRRVGVCRVQKLTGSMATAEPTLGDGFQKGDVARYFSTR
jgi:hypothetical protein